ncbi:hypothetical protein [Shinella zoogloeoides]|uniref:hypothetical protein n=1 Tax=Shinella zoogloeoides TaxID=352475 RepID=UPI00273FF89E|nr:hypothetical protein [Shinella zoogloeoides]WLR92911.1 hypothetical protein Q9316_01505 [Shinella zoogloeoides]
MHEHKSQGRDRLRSAFRKGVRKGIQEGRILEREAQAIRLSPILFITPEGLDRIRSGGVLAAVRSDTEFGFTVPLYLGLTGTANVSSGNGGGE